MSVHEEGDRADQEKSLKAVEDKWINVFAPCMPILTSANSNRTQHRHVLADFDFPFNLLVAEPIIRIQRKQVPKAQAACDKEWEKNKRLKRSTWDPSTVCEWNFVATEFKRTGIKVHVAKIFEICVVKGAELDDKDPRHIFKGRAVLDGSWVKDENYDVDLFNEMGSSLAIMQAGKAVDVFGLQPGYTLAQGPDLPE